jgi:hypothetical protein
MRLGLIALFFSTSLCLAESPSKTISFKDDIYPLLNRRCFECHQGKDAESGYRLDLREEILGQTNGQPLAIPGESAKSEIIKRISATDKTRMPPKGNKRLSEDEIALLRAWIDQGLPWDEKLLPPLVMTSDHWAFQPIKAPPMPPTTDWCKSPIDNFIAAAQQAKNLRPAPQADRRTIIRRVTFDLTGLPPTHKEVQEFLADQSTDAHENLIDRLLASPHYGEHWGRHWLDVARYADTEGYEMNYPRPFAWRYRDWVVKAFNDDKPFDQFIRQQIAGDEIAPYADENLIATGFLASARYSCNEDDLHRQRIDVQLDITNATASSLLGLTLGCAQCHNHKFDPITQRDYYRFQAFFAKSQLLNLHLKDPVLWKEYEAANPKPAKPQTFGFYSPLSPNNVEAEPLRAVFVLPYNPDELKKSEAHILVRGDIHKLGPAVSPSWPAVFGSEPSEGVVKTPRTVLADWLTSEKNPLVARVYVNRIWQYHFGRGIVATPGDFGVKGSAPSHPELLDYLASELLRHKSTKQLHKLILLSATYRQSSRGDEAGGRTFLSANSAEKDPENIYLTRFKPHRLESESIRDAILATSGELDAAMGGAPIARAAEAQHPRRSLYLTLDRNDFPDMHTFFDGPSTSESCPRRQTSTIPLQPLYMLNDNWILDRARAFADRILSTAGNDPNKQLMTAFRLAFARDPDEKEKRLALAFLGTATSQPSLLASIPPPQIWSGANWIWNDPNSGHSDQSPAPRYFRKSFELSAKPISAEIHLTADDKYTFYLNAREIGSGQEWNTPGHFDIGRLLVVGKNTIAVKAENGTGPAGFIAWMRIISADRRETIIASDNTWKVSLDARPDWEGLMFNDEKWPAASIAGNSAAGPWSLAPAGAITPPPRKPLPLKLVHFCHALLNLNEFVYVN